MYFLRVFMTVCRLTGPYWCAPWRSPLLRWRMETYGITDEQGRLLSAAHITPGRFLRFCWQHRADLTRFLRWSATLESP